MEHESFLGGLSLFTLVAVLVVVAAVFFYFLSSRKNRAAAKRAHGIDENAR